MVNLSTIQISINFRKPAYFFGILGQFVSIIQIPNRFWFILSSCPLIFRQARSPPKLPMERLRFSYGSIKNIVHRIISKLVPCAILKPESYYSNFIQTRSVTIMSILDACTKSYSFFKVILHFKPNEILGTVLASILS